MKFSKCYHWTNGWDSCLGDTGVASSGLLPPADLREQAPLWGWEVDDKRATLTQCLGSLQGFWTLLLHLLTYEGWVHKTQSVVIHSHIPERAWETKSPPVFILQHQKCKRLHLSPDGVFLTAEISLKSSFYLANIDSHYTQVSSQFYFTQH